MPLEPQDCQGTMHTKAYLEKAANAVSAWEARWGPFEVHPALRVDDEKFELVFDNYLSRLEGNYPFFHPRYAGQMLKPPHPVAIAGYLAAMLINPNNHALDGGPPTSEMEKEVVSDIVSMFGFPDDALGHLTSSGTIANLEAIWIAREMHPEKAIAVSDQAHYTHGRLGELLKVEIRTISSDDSGRMRLDILEEELRSGKIGTVVATAGTTGFGAVDPVADIRSLCDRHGARVHVDGAYGGFFVLLANDTDFLLDAETRRHLQAIAHCDSVVVDPHKHGLQPYGCGCILFSDPRAGRVYQHDSPYTYFTSDALHLGEISFECSRAGAAAGALWLTLQMLPLTAEEGLGPVLAAGTRAARAFHHELDESDGFRPLIVPELDIVCYFPTPDPPSVAAIDAASKTIFDRSMNRPNEQLFVSLLRVEADRLMAAHPATAGDAESARILRSVLMKPEHEHHVDLVMRLLSEAAAHEKDRHHEQKSA